MPVDTLPDLDDDFGALEPHVSARIMELHHDEQHAAYVKGANTALERLAEARRQGLDEGFGDFEKFRKQMTAAAGSLMGSGWAALAWEPLDQRPVVSQTYDHQSNVTQAATPLLVLDGWEHAYSLQYENRKADFFQAVWNVWNWSDASRGFDAARQ